MIAPVLPKGKLEPVPKEDLELGSVNPDDADTLLVEQQKVPRILNMNE